jgi:sulfite exporter TauE/SafE
MSIALLTSAWLVGALGGVHCVAMCGGLVGALGARDAARAQTLHPARTLALRQAGYHAGRIATYALLGALFGTAGAAALGAVDLVALQRAIYVIANVLLLFLGAALVMGMRGVPLLQRAGVGAFAPLLRVAQPLLRRHDAAGRIATGLIWGLMPCAMIYSVLPLALLAGGAWQGALVMLAFGLGTLPNLLAAGVMLGRVRASMSGQLARIAGAALLIAFGVLGMWRIVASPDALAQGPFCLVL